MITLIATSLLATFQGGSASDFATALHDASKQGALVCQGEGWSIPKCEFETSDLTELARVVKNQTGLSFAAGQDIVFSDNLLAKKLVTPTTFRGAFQPRPAPQQGGSRDGGGQFERPSAPIRVSMSLSPVGLPGTAIKDGKVTFKTGPAERLDLTSLVNVFSKPIKMHWIYEETVVCLNVSDLPELELKESDLG